MADPIVDPLAPPSPPAPGTVGPVVTPATPSIFSQPTAPPAVPSAPITPPAPVEPTKPKAAYLIVEPLETPTSEIPVADGKTIPPGKEQIVATGDLTVVMVKTTGSVRVHRWNGVKLPKDAADLSVVEVHRDPASTGPDVAVFPNKDERIGTLPVNDGKNSSACAVGVGSNKPVSFRKMSKTLWVVIS
jgi:hypothetical protein